MDKVLGNLLIVVDENNYLLNITTSDVKDLDVLISDLQRCCDWTLNCTEKFRHYARFTPRHAILVDQFDELSHVLMQECNDLITDIQIETDHETLATPSIIQILQDDLRDKIERREGYHKELQDTQVQGDSIERGSQEQALDRIRQRIGILDKSIQKASDVINFLSTEGWDGLCCECDETLPVKRLLLAHSLKCVVCAEKSE